jgi:ATP-binding dynein motor region
MRTFAVCSLQLVIALCVHVSTSTTAEDYPLNPHHPLPSGNLHSVQICGRQLLAQPGFRLMLAASADGTADAGLTPRDALRVNVVDCRASVKGVESQLLAALVRAERPELEGTRDSLVLSIAADRRQLRVRDTNWLHAALRIQLGYI